MTLAIPTAIRNYNHDGRLEIDWSDGHRSHYSHENLRINCPCASCQGHTPDQAKTIVGKKAARIDRIEPVGNYALKIAFDDGHETGLYNFTELRESFCECAGHVRLDKRGR